MLNKKMNNGSQTEICVRNGIEYEKKGTGYIWVAPDVLEDFPEQAEQQKRSDEYFERMLKINGSLAQYTADDSRICRSEWVRENNQLFCYTKMTHQEIIPVQTACQMLTMQMIDQVMMKLIEAFNEIHKAGVVHMAINPKNVYLVRNEDGTVDPCIKGFDQSMLEHSVPVYEEISITPYSAPETARYVKNKGGWSSAALISSAADQYSLAILWHEMLTGEKVTAARGCSTAYEAVLKNKDVCLSYKLDKLHRSVMSRMLNPDPKKRYGSMKEIALDYMTAREMENPEDTVADTKDKDKEVSRSDHEWNDRFKKKAAALFTPEQEEGDLEERLFGSASNKEPIDYRLTEIQHFDIPVLGRYTDIMRVSDDLFMITTVKDRRLYVYRNMLGAFGFNELAEPLNR